MLAQCVGQGVGPPEKHATVPEIVSSGQKLGRFRQIGLFGETANAKGAISIGRAGFDVSITGFGTRGADAEDDNVFSRCGDLNPLAESFAILFRIAYDVVGGKKAEDRVGIV